MRKSVCLITAFVVFILQATVLPFIFNGSTQPNLIFLFVVLMSLHYGKKVAIITALLGGFTQDVVLGNFFGVHLLPYLIIATICSYIGRYIEEEQWLLTLLLVLGATLFYLVVTCGVLFLAGQYVHLVAYLVEFSLPMLIYHGVLALPVNHFVRKMSRHDLYYTFMDFRH